MVKLIIFSVIQSYLLVQSQVFYKIGLTKIEKSTSVYNLFVQLISNLYFWMTFFSICIAGVFWTYVVKNFDFSLAYPLLSITYIFSMLAAMIIFKEYVPYTRWIGVALIIIGIIFISKS